MERILVLNTGSSSLKYALFDYMKSSTKRIILLSHGVIAHIGEHEQHIKHSNINKIDSITQSKVNTIKSHKHALSYTLDLINNQSGNDKLSAVGHRVVHGGETLYKPTLITNAVINEIRKSIPLAPLHNPHNLHGIETAINLLPTKNIKQVAVFDTGFHSTIPPHAFMYGIPYRLYKEHGIRKYGFHGINHEYVLYKTSEYLKTPVDQLNIISCHLGAGCSICCIKNGKSIDTSMGMTPLEGLIMSTRSGDLDSNVIFYITEKLKLSLKQCKHLLENESGWFGISGFKDAISLCKAYEENDDIAKLTVLMMVHRIRKYIGSYYWQLQGNVHAIVFTAGLGENWPDLRELCLDESETLGFIIDRKKNETRCTTSDVLDISSIHSKSKVLVVPANEELNIAQKIVDYFL